MVRPAAPQRPPAALPAPQPANSPKWNPSEAVRSIWARSVPRAPTAPEPNPKIEAALERWRKAAEWAGNREGGASTGFGRGPSWAKPDRRQQELLDGR